MGAGFGRRVLESYAHPELSRGGMCVHVKKWRKDAQPEWPEAPSDTQVIPATGEVRGRAATQSFPDTGRTGVDGVSRGDFADLDGTQVLTGGPRPLPEHDRTFDLRDPWEPAGESPQTHDPHEVTVQLDAVSLDDARLRTAEGAPGGSDGSDGPVFVDESGRRSRRFRRLGIAVGIACAVYAVVIVITLLSGSSDAPWLPVPGQKDEKPAGQVDPTSRPADSAVPSGTGSVPAGSTPTASDGTSPSAGTSGASSGASADPAAPGTSTKPDPTPTKSQTNPGTGGGGNPKPSNSVEQPPTSSSPDPTVSESPAGPTETTGPGTGTGTGSVADGPVTPTPVAEEPGTPTASSASSPENNL